MNTLFPNTKMDQIHPSNIIVRLVLDLCHTCVNVRH